MGDVNIQEKRKFMQRALDLATLGMGQVSPNPMVGCVIVKDGKVLGEGWHQKFGGLHAEPNAVSDVKDEADIKGADVYVTLEPCSHFGKTPPCAELLVKHAPAKVIICNLDPNPLVSGRGISLLEKNGIGVETGLLEEKGRFLNRRFFTFMEKKRPYVILKWAQTIDGYIARENYDSKWISGELSRKEVHLWRSHEAAIMVGTNTAIYDNPKLNVRWVSGENPVRVVLDRNLQLSKGMNLFDQSQVTLVYNAKENRADEYIQYVKIPFGEGMIEALLEDLYKRKILSVIIEGGAKLLNTYINADIWDEARVFTGPEEFGNGIKAPELTIKPVESRNIGEDELLIYRK